MDPKMLICYFPFINKLVVYSIRLLHYINQKFHFSVTSIEVFFLFPLSDIITISCCLDSEFFNSSGPSRRFTILLL